MSDITFVWCEKNSRRIATQLCISCSNRKCINKPKHEVKHLTLERQENILNMYIGRSSIGNFNEIFIQDFKNPTEEELQGVDLIYEVKSIFKPVMKITLEQIKENKDGIQQQPSNSGESKDIKLPRKRKSSKGSSGEV